MPIEVKSFASQADEAKDMPNARMEAVNVLGQRVMKLTLAPGWKWSTDIKPIVGTPSCQATHTGIIVEGTIHCVCDDGSESTYSAGDAYAISPNHDAWCVGGKRAVVYEFAGAWGGIEMSLYQKLTKVMDDRDVEGYVALIHEDAEIVFHKSGNKFTKTEWADMVVGMMGNPKFVNDASRCVYENDEILVSHDFMSYPDDTKEAVMLVCMLKDGQIIRMETGATPLA